MSVRLRMCKALLPDGYTIRNDAEEMKAQEAFMTVRKARKIFEHLLNEGGVSKETYSAALAEVDNFNLHSGKEFSNPYLRKWRGISFL